MSKVLVLRTCKADGTSPSSDANGFKWPTSVTPGEEVHVKCDDWDPKPEYGNGLHGFLRGECHEDPSGYGAYIEEDALWYVLKVEESTVVDLKGKCKFPECDVVFVGQGPKGRDEALQILQKAYSGVAILYGNVSVGDNCQANTGFMGKATAGTRGRATAGDYGTATAGDYGKATAGDYGKATAGTRGTATAGDHGTATAGYRGTATAGECGTATAGYCGTATAGDHGTAIAGVGGILQIKWHGGDRYRLATAYVGENGIEPNVPYKLDDKGNFVKV